MTGVRRGAEHQILIEKVTTSDGNRVEASGPIPDLDQPVWKDRDVYIAYDADIVRKSEVRAARSGLRKELRQRGANVGQIEWEEGKGKGIDEFIYAQGPRALFELLERAKDTTKPGGWKSRLQTSNN